MERSYETALVWLRRDLRLRDNIALAHAARAASRVAMVFNIDPALLRSDRMGAPIAGSFFSALRALRAELREYGSDLIVTKGDFAHELTAVALATGATAVFYNEDYEPYARERDARVTAALEQSKIDVHASLDHVYYGADEIQTDGGTPYKVYSPYRRRWLERHAAAPRAAVASLRAARPKFIAAAALPPSGDVPDAADFGFTLQPAYPTTSEVEAKRRFERFLAYEAAAYGEQRDIPSLDATSHLSPDLRAGTIGVRTCFEVAFAHAARATPAAKKNIEKWIAELIWREFYQMILARFPHVVESPFVAAAADVRWRDDTAGFDAWKAGMTGYPIVDAAMRQLNATGWMHNRLRMIVASFLTKDLLINWQLGERYFEQHLADADVAQNNGGWQWAASTGADAAPYFRVFNPELQSKKFDSSGEFIRAFVPELRDVPDEFIHAPQSMPPLQASAMGFALGRDYPEPIVDHFVARDRAIAAYASVLRDKQRG